MRCEADSLPFSAEVDDRLSTGTNLLFHFGSYVLNTLEICDYFPLPLGCTDCRQTITEAGLCYFNPEIPK